MEMLKILHRGTNNQEKVLIEKAGIFEHRLNKQHITESRCCSDWQPRKKHGEIYIAGMMVALAISFTIKQARLHVTFSVSMNSVVYLHSLVSQKSRDNVRNSESTIRPRIHISPCILCNMHLEAVNLPSSTDLTLATRSRHLNIYLTISSPVIFITAHRR